MNGVVFNPRWRIVIANEPPAGVTLESIRDRVRFIPVAGIPCTRGDCGGTGAAA